MKRIRFLVFPTVVLMLMLGVLFSASLSAESPSPQIRLRTFTFDPLKAEPGLATAMRRSPMTATEPTTAIVQFVGPVQQRWKDAVAATGARLYGYLPDYAFVARLDAHSSAQVSELPFVRWVGGYHPAYAISPDLMRVRTEAGPASPLSLVINTLPDADLEQVTAEIESLGGVVASSVANEYAGYVRATLSPDRLFDVSRIDGVLWIEAELPRSLYNDRGGGGIMRGYEIQRQLGLYGAGQIAGVADSGLDVGRTADIHPDLAGKVVQAFCLGRPDPCDWSDPHGHGTHVSGSVLGNGVKTGSDPAQHKYEGTGAGVAPEARLVFQSTMDSQGGLSGIPNDLMDLMRQAYDAGARTHNNSWGGPTGGTPEHKEWGGYDITSQQADAAARNFSDMLIVVSAGNNSKDGNGDGVIDPDSLGSPGTAKNVLTVGASENNRSELAYTWGGWWPNDYPVNPINGDLIADNANGLAAFSSRGPTDDGRIKPDVVAPGTRILSISSQHPNHEIEQTDYINQWYRFMDGTSMSGPLTTGAATIVREWLTRIRGLASPSSALMKAVLINGTADMSPGQYGGGQYQEIGAMRPNIDAGWGRIDLVGSVAPGGNTGVWLQDDKPGLGTGQTRAYQLTLTAASQQNAEPAAAPAKSANVRPAGTNLIVNGSFESDAAWSADTFGRSNMQAHSGSWSAKSTAGSDGYLFQVVSIPADATSAALTYFWYNEDGEEYVDEMAVSIYSGDLQEVLLTADYHSSAAPGWHGEGVDLASILDFIAGEDVAVVFEVIQDGWEPNGVFYVDDVSLNVEQQGGPTPTATTAPPTSTPTGPTPTPTTTPSPGGGGAFRITLAWTDYPGQAEASHALVNDLDLEVIAPDGKRYVGNGGLYNGGVCLRGGEWDACNNVEGIILPNAPAGEYKVFVYGRNVPQGPQPFALAASGPGIRSGGGPQPTTTPFPGLSPVLYMPLITK